MVGKIKRIRQKLHQGAVKLSQEGGERSTLFGLEEVPVPAGGKEFLLPKIVSTDSAGSKQPQKEDDGCKDKRRVDFPSTVFAGTKIKPEALVQTLKFEEQSAIVSNQTRPEDKKQHSKKQKIKDRRERWLNKIGAIKLAKEQQVALARRKATPVVGDMRALADALPELSQLVTTSRTSTRRKAKVPVKKKPEQTDFSLMKPAQKRKLLETETTRFSEALKNPSFKANPLATIGEHLRKRLRQEEEQGPG